MADVPPALEMRKQPRQARSQALVASLLDATARVLADERSAIGIAAVALQGSPEGFLRSGERSRVRRRRACRERKGEGENGFFHRQAS